MAKDITVRQEVINTTLLRMLFDECNHKINSLGVCSHCGAHNIVDNNLFTPEGFFRLLNKIKTLPWYDFFMCYLYYADYGREGGPQLEPEVENDNYLHVDQIDPLVFPELIFVFLQRKGAGEFKYFNKEEK